MSDGESFLPTRYLDDRLHVLATGPTGCWVYWDEGVAVWRLVAAYLPNGWQTAPRQLRVREAQGEERTVDCRADYGSLHLTGLRAGGLYRVEYGVVIDGHFLPLLEQQVRLPGAGTAAKRMSERHESISSYSLYRQS